MSSTLLVESFEMSPRLEKKVSTNVRELGGATEKYVKLKYISKDFLLITSPLPKFKFMTGTQ